MRQWSFAAAAGAVIAQCAVSNCLAQAQTHALLPKAACIKLDRPGLETFLEAWTTAHAGASAERLMALYARDAVVVGLGSTQLTSGHDNIRALYAKQKYRQRRAHFAEINAQFACNEAVVAGTYTFLAAGVKPEEGIPGQLRYRMDLAFREGQWFVTHHQSSHLPVQSEHTVKMSSGTRSGTGRTTSSSSPSGSETRADSGGYKAGGWVNGAPRF